MKKFAFGMLAFALTGCAGAGHSQFVGQPITSVMAEMGKPSQIIELPDGRRAYQWEDTRTVVGATGGFSASNMSPMTFAWEIDCRSTLITENNGQDWVVVEAERKKLSC